jgi:hypothetical protein
MTWQEERCTRQFVLNVEKNVKSRSSQMVVDQFTAESVIVNVETQGDIRLTS